MYKVRRKRRQSELYCGHCDEVLSKSAYWKHRRTYFDPTTEQWTKKTSLDQSQTRSVKNQSVLNIDDSSDNDDSQTAADSSNEVPFAQVLQAESDEHSDSGDSVDEMSSEESLPSESEDEQVWHDKEEDLLRDINEEDTPLPEPRSKPTMCRALTSLLSWFVYFLLFWQTTCKISDNGLEWLLRFMFQFIHSLGVTCSNEYLIQMSMMFPSSLYLLRQFVKLDRDDFTKYAVCPECTRLYHLDNWTIRVGNRIESRRCTNKPFRSGRKRECGALLARKVTTQQNKTVFYPFKLYCFNSIINQLECILKRPGMSDLLEKWRKRQMKPGVMADIFDGQIWKDFKTNEGKDFLEARNNIALGINVDWFQPYKRRKDRSVGAIYFVILNLPREERYKWENVIVAGIIPELKKEPKSLNTFLGPVVDELKALWKGVKLQTSNRTPQLHRAAVLLASSDILASRKLCGFKGHSAHRGCSKCFKFFPSSFADKTDYLGFNVEDWPLRDNETHRINAVKVRSASTKTKHEKLAKQYGVYYSKLLDLDYFDAIRFTVVDPMHNLFLGSAKHLFKIGIKEDILNNKALTEIEKRILKCDVPTGFGRLPSKIASNYGCYTASQWKNWTLIYSIYCLKGLLHEEHFKCWQTYVLACQYMSKHLISEGDVNLAHGLFVKFCKQIEQLYGKEMVTPNMHLHCHLKNCVLDYGPLHAFWCFSFERFNGILGATQMNGRSIEVQLMRKLIVSKFTWNCEMPNEFKETFLPFFKHSNSEMDAEFCDQNAVYFSTSALNHNLKEVKWNHDLSFINLPKSCQYMTIDDDDLHLLLECYKYLLPDDVEDISIDSLSSIARKYSYVFLGTERFGSRKDNKSL